MKLSSLSLKTSLIGAISLLLLLLCGQGLFALSSIGRVFGDVETMAAKWVPSIDITNKINTAISDLRGSENRHIVNRTEAGMKRADDAIATDLKKLEERMRIYDGLVDDPEERELYAKFKDVLATYLKQHDELIAMSRAGKKDEAGDFLTSAMRQSYTELDKLADGFRDINLAGAKHSYADSSAGFASARIATFMLLAIACLAGLGAMTFAIVGISRPINRTTAVMRTLADGDLSLEIPFTDRANEIGAMARAVEVFKQNGIKVRELNAQEAALQAKSTDLQSSIGEVVSAAVAGDFTRRITKTYDHADLDRFATQVNELVTSVDRGVAETRRVISALAEGDLTENMRGEFQGAFRELQSNVNQTMANLRSVLGEVRSAIDTINGGAGEMRVASGDLSKRTEQQAASLEETSSALEEITATVKSSTERATEASHMVDEARKSTEQSSAVVKDAVSAMGRIEEASGEIGQIINVIDEIAFQTNLLALNAGVEAARAGEAGKGFAVVAQEVRELAQRSANAAKDIKALISRSGTEVEAGVKLVTATGAALTLIEGHVIKVNEHVHSIATAAREQSTGLSEVSTAVNQMDQVTQQNAAMVEESTAATGRLADEAANLARLIAHFKIEVGTAPRAAAADTRPITSPARALTRKLAGALGGRAATAAVAANWEEF
ncbi:HAMP domain-containing methyl-accepting chemotaxis protein [Sinorhizobium americanum]|uniref:Chemoreceptor McpA n=1 Tax=Sinorhizobium americanum TaxID=194963 RepID=A0A1L3LU70_9HYPH|nr:methyl-accepting chemotaxis protein [Sinorhizobium americanum]APG87121.1 chemoreceptor McpA [Sinorhizobium americanum CCGM7]APG93635.1 chemoreceptor McpA [Sinorhizobium americanum]OAP43970.1 chemotaxis protein [Sinorhizobium americanum]